MIYATITTSFTTHPHKSAITKLRFNKGFHQNYSAFNCHEFADPNKRTYFSARFLHCDKICSSKRKFRSIKIPKSFSFTFPNFALSDVCQEQFILLS